MVFMVWGAVFGFVVWGASLLSGWGLGFSFLTLISKRDMEAMIAFFASCFTWCSPFHLVSWRTTVLSSKVKGLRFRGSGFRVQGSGFEVQGFRFRV